MVTAIDEGDVDDGGNGSLFTSQFMSLDTSL